jgi:hypothetical protein
MGFTVAVACLAEQGERRLVVADGLLVPALLQVDKPQIGQHRGLTEPTTGRPARGKSLQEALRGLRVTAQAPLDDAQVRQGPRLAPPSPTSRYATALEAIAAPLVTSSPQVNQAEVHQCAGFPAAVADLLAEPKRLLEVACGLPEAALPQIHHAPAGQCFRLSGMVADLPRRAAGVGMESDSLREVAADIEVAEQARS